MSTSRSDHHQDQSSEPKVDKHALIFGLISVFLCGIGFSIIAPVVPFLVQPYISDPGKQAVIVTLLTSAYAACLFCAAPVLGALSDKYGRRPLLLLCLLGSAAGYFIFGLGGLCGRCSPGGSLKGSQAGASVQSSLILQTSFRRSSGPSTSAG